MVEVSDSKKRKSHSQGTCLGMRDIEGGSVESVHILEMDLCLDLVFEKYEMSMCRCKVD